MDDDLFSEADFEQAPCEFCDELFPFDLLIQHQSGCRPDLANFTYGRNSDEENSEDDGLDDLPEVMPAPKQVAKAVEETRNVPKAKPTDFGELIVEAKKSISETVKIKADEKQKSPPPKDVGKLMKIEDPIMQENGVKLMAYGSNINKDKQVEIEKPSFKIPSLLNNADQKEVDNESFAFTDSDEGESLEDFWKRAEIKNYQRLRTLNSGKATVC